MKRAGKSWKAYLFLLPYTLSFLTFIVVPILVSAGLSVSNLDLTSRRSSGDDAAHFKQALQAPQSTSLQAARFVGSDNYKEAIKDEKFQKALVATVSFAVWMVPSLLVVAFAFSLGLNAMRKGRNLVRGLLFLPVLFNVVVAALIWRWFFENEFGFFNYLLKQVGVAPVHWLSEQGTAMRSVVAMSLWWSLGGTTVILLAGLQQIPRQLYEAAMLDGANGPALFNRITLPQLRPVLTFVVVTSTIGAFQVFGQPFLMTGGGPELSTRSLVQLIYDTAFNQYRLGYAAAISWILFAMIGVLVVLQLTVFRRAVD